MNQVQKYLSEIGRKGGKAGTGDSKKRKEEKMDTYKTLDQVRAEQINHD